MKTRTQYTFVSMIPHLTDYGYNKLYVEAFVSAINDYAFMRHMLDEENPQRPPDTHGWSYGIEPRYFDGRVTSKRVSWVFARKDAVMPEEACAMVYFTTRLEPIGFLVKVK